MLLRSLTWLVLFVVLAGCGESAPKPAPAPAAGPKSLTAHEKNVRDFEFDGVSFKTTEAELRESKKILGDNERLDEFEKLVNWQGFVFHSEAADTVHVDYYEGHVVGLTLWYDPKRLAAMGGVKAIIKQLVNKFGDPQGSPLDNAGPEWEFPKVARKVHLVAIGPQVMVSVVDPERYTKGRNAADEAKEAAQPKVKTGLE